MKELSIFVDESGDFGEYSKHSPYYIIAMVFHNQDYSISEDITKLDYELSVLGLKNATIHTEPLIRKEEMFCNMSPNERRAIFTKLYFFMQKINFKFKTFHFYKKEYDNPLKLEARMAKEISGFIRKHLDYFQSFDVVRLYYDNGQYQITRILNTVLATELSDYDSKKVLPKDYKLLQVADMLCTIRLVSLKADNKEWSNSERIIFHSISDFKKDFVKRIKAKEFID